MDINKLTIKAQEALQSAKVIANSYNNQFVSSLHLLKAIINDKDGITSTILKKIGININQLNAQIEEAIEKIP
ncbi:MAG: Clp protease N-terminal domain-containing protein, partial [Desulfurella sp.]